MVSVNSLLSVCANHFSTEKDFYRGKSENYPLYGSSGSHEHKFSAVNVPPQQSLLNQRLKVRIARLFRES